VGSCIVRICIWGVIQQAGVLSACVPTAVWKGAAACTNAAGAGGESQAGGQHIPILIVLVAVPLVASQQADLMLLTAAMS
jgi:hypothetical protein